jgi:predicted solute-binding protein
MKFGCVPYLNAKPLCFGLEANFAVPSQLANTLHEGGFDAALIPVAEYLRHPQYILVDNVAIGCTGPVYSVILAHEVPIHEVLTISLDPASLTSNLLMQVLAPEIVSSQVRFVGPGTKSHAQVLIGDAAIHFRHDAPQIPVVDLGEVWNRVYGLPFIFAVWAMRPEKATPELADQLRAVKKAGLAERRTLALTDFEYRYLTEYIQYDLATTEKNGLLQFARSLVTLGVIPKIPQFHWL